MINIDFNELAQDILIAVIILGFFLMVCMTSKNEGKEKINELEEKLNIYERNYEEFCLQDSLRQSD